MTDRSDVAVSDQPKTPRSEMRDYRARMRAAGLRPIQLWVPDLKAKGFAAKLRRQVAKLDPREEARQLNRTLAFVLGLAE